MADQNILVRITGEADLTEAQVQMRSLNDRGKELEKQMQDLVAAEKLQTAALRKMSRATAEDRAKAEESLKTTQKQIRETQASINANQKNIQTLGNTISTYNAMNGAGGKLAQQIKALREQMAQMEMAGDTSSQAFIEMGVELAKLTDQVGDTQAQIRILASDTKNLDAAMSVGTGVAGAFNVATSAAALLGDESEKLQQAFLKVQAVMAILNGVQQVANVLNKDSAANVVLRTALQKLFNKEKQKEVATTGKAAAASGMDAAAKGAQAVATKGATIAQKALNLAMKLNPAFLLMTAIGGLISVFSIFKSRADEAAQKQREFNEQMHEKAVERINEYKSALDQLRSANESLRDSLDMRTDEQKWQDGIDESKAHVVELQQSVDDLADKIRRRRENLYLGIGVKGMTDEEAKRSIEDWEQQKEVLRQTIREEEKKQDLLQQRIDKERADKAAEAAAKLNEEQKRRAEERRRAIEDAEKQLQDVRIALMQDGLEKELARINLDFDRKIAAITGNSKTEIELRKALEQQRSQEIQKVEKRFADEELALQNEIAQLRLQNEMAIAENNGGERLYELKKELLQRQRDLEVASIEATIENEVLKAEKIRSIETKLASDLADLEKQHTEETISDARLSAEIKVKEAENAAMRILNNENSTDEQIKEARETLANHEKNLRDIRMQELKSQYDAHLISEKEFQDAKLDIEREALDEEAEMIANKAELTKELANTILQFVGDMASEIFGAISDSIQQQIDDLDEYYTTDAEEAKEDASKKYITEKELNDKKLALKRKQAAVDKASAAFTIALNTAMGIMNAMTVQPLIPLGVAMAATVGALGATQLAMVLAKPLPKYAKGRKRGKGEYAMVGERGAELMWIPDNASIVPHHKVNKPETWGDYDVPMPYIPTQPEVEREIIRSIVMQHVGIAGLDYDRIGKSVADNIHIPEQKAVYVTVDRNGIGVSEGGDSHTYLNRKYQGAWN